MYRFADFIKENVQLLDPYNEEDWEGHITVYPDIGEYVLCIKSNENHKKGETCKVVKLTRSLIWLDDPEDLSKSVHRNFFYNYYQKI